MKLIPFYANNKTDYRLRTAASDYVTLVQQAINKVTGFHQLYKELDRAINQFRKPSFNHEINVIKRK